MYADSADSTTLSKLLDITEFPDLGGEPELLDTTTLTDASSTYILGIQSVEGLSFTANFTPEDYATINDLADGEEHSFGVYFGGTSSSDYGELCTFTFNGIISVFVNGAGVNEVRTMTITIAPTTEIEFTQTTTTA